MMNLKNNNIKFFLFLALLLFIVVPFGLPSYQVFIATEIIIFALYAVSYNMLLGNAGLLSFGHAMFFGTGAYTTAIISQNFTVLPIYGVVFLSVILTTIIGFIIGALLLQHKGSYFALLTLAFNALFYAIASKWHTVTGGDDGISVIRNELGFGLTNFNMSDIIPFYFFTLVFIGLILLFCYYFATTAMGKTILLMRENEERMKFLGYNTNIARLILFTFTASLAGCAGAFYALCFEFTSLSAISIDMTTTVLLITFTGGIRTFWGPILGAAVYVYLQDYLSDITDRWQLIMGIIFIVMVLYVPDGLSGLLIDMKEKALKYLKIQEKTEAKGHVK